MKGIKGDLLLQKIVTGDFLNKKRTDNNGYANQYYVGAITNRLLNLGFGMRHS